MDDLRLLLRYATRLLLIIAPLEFLFGRAISRASRQMPAGDVGAATFGAISNVGGFLVMPAFVLVVLVLALTALLAWRPAPGSALPAGDTSGLALSRPLALLLGLFLVCSVVLLLPDAPPQVLFAYNLLSAALVLSLAARFLVSARAGTAVRVSVGLFGLAYAGYYAYALAALLAQAGNAPLGDFGVLANALGEGAGMAAAISLLWTAGPLARAPGARPPRRLPAALAVLAAAVLLIAPLFEQWLQGVATQFSVGFTLFLPVPVTALALAAWVYAVLVANRGDAAARTGLPWAWEFGAGLLLLPAAGYQLQLNYQHLLLAAVFLLWTGALRPFSGAPDALPQAGSAAPAALPQAIAAAVPTRPPQPAAPAGRQ